MSHRSHELSNSQLAELLAIQSERETSFKQRALRRAARRAFLWPEEATNLFRQGRSLTELSAVGPYLARCMQQWIEEPPQLSPPPEIRAGFLTITEARAALAKDPGWRAGIRGDLQMHTVWSDGSGTVREMAEAACERSYEYISITDHSKGLKIAGGIDEAQLQQQAEEIAELNAWLSAAGKRLRVIRSVELNLDPAGQGDMDERSLAQLDLVLGCFHSSLRKKEDQTERFLAALRNSSIHILGHPRGRIYNFRLGLRADWPRVFGLAAELDKAVEVDAYPDRQDLSPDLLSLAKQAGCRISLGTDSHGTSQLAFMDFAAASAMLAGISRDRILNFMSRGELLNWARKLRDATRAA